MLDTTPTQVDRVEVILNHFFLAQEFPPPLTLDQFVLSLVEEGIRSCETTNEHGVVFCDIKVSH